MWWILYVTVPGFILLVGYLALYFGAWGWFASAQLRRRGLSDGRLLLTLPAGWVALEYLRSHLLTGLGWNLLAHTQWNWIELIQLADFTGVTGLSFLVVLVNVGLWQRLRRSMGRIFVAGVCFLAALAYGTLRLGQLDLPSPPSRPSFKVAVLQGNIPQYEKWDATFQESIWKRYEALTRKAAESQPDLILWPETAVPGYLEEEEIWNRLQRLIRQVGAALLVGSPTTNAQGTDVFNSALLFDPEGAAVERYDKVHLVPFGEYLPLTPVLGWLRRFVLMGNYSPGSRLTVFDPAVATGQPKAARFSVLICFEDLFPDLCRRFIQEGARWLVVITNDAWFIYSAASLQHTQASVFRAIEGRVWVARAANTGWSGFIDPAGRRKAPPAQIPRFEPGVALSQIQPSLGLTGYLRWGDWLPILCCIISFFELVLWKRWISLSNNAL